MANIWTEENKYRAWLGGWKSWRMKPGLNWGEIPKEDVALIREKRTLTSTVFWKSSSKLATMWWPSHAVS